MNKKILIAGFFTAMMLVITFSSAADLEGAASELEIYKQYVNSDPVQKPNWLEDHFWEYNLSLGIINPGCTLFSIDATRMDIVVISPDNEDEYTLNICGYLDKFMFNSLNYAPDASYVSGKVHINKSTLSMKSFELSLSGNSQNINFDVVMNMGFDPKLDFLNFPIELNDQWNIETNVDITINGNIETPLGNIPVEIEYSDMLLSDSLKVVLKELVNVKGGTFESFKISGELGDSSNLWYSPNVGYLTNVEITKKFPLNFNLGCNLELLSTNFNYPEDNGAPYLPDISGPDKGQTGEEYEYTVSTTDPESEQVYYKIDWGDGTCSDWLGPYSSGEEVKVKHTWTGEATYNIRAKAKDIHGYQTRWSSPMSVKMPVNTGVTAIPGDSTTSPTPSGSTSSQQQSSQQQSTSKTLVSGTLSR